MRVVDLKSLVCSKNHTFDFTKQGYLNLMTHATDSQYSKELFEARNKIIIESNLYAPMHQTITKVMKEYINLSKNPIMVADLGCGEGSHLQRIIDECSSKKVTGVGIDIAKEAILLAAKRYENIIWLVGDLAKSPLADQSVQVILNILSPSNYKEFKRIINQEGLVIKVVPRPNYLKELREAVFEHERQYTNDETVTLYKQHFKLLDVIPLCYTKQLNKEELDNLVQMTPLSWSADKKRMESFLQRDTGEITVDLDILVGMKKNTNEMR